MSVFSLLNRYLTRQFLFWVLCLFFIFVCVIGLFEALELTRKAMGKPSVTFSLIIAITIMKIPFMMQKLLPFILFVGALIGFWRMNQNQEITAVRALGLSAWRFSAGIVMATVGLGVLNLMFLNPLSAVMGDRAGRLEQQFFKRDGKAMSISDSGIWLREKTETGASILKIQRFDISQSRFESLSFFDFDMDGIFRKRVDVPVAFLKDNQWISDKIIICNDEGEVQKASLNRPTALTLEKIQNGYTPPENLSFWELPNFVEMLKKSGLSTLRYELYWHTLISKILMMVAMVVFAAAFTLHPARYRRVSTLAFGGVLLGLFIHFISDVIFALGLGGKLPVILAAWAPSVLAFSGGAVLLLHVESGA